VWYKDGKRHRENNQPAWIYYYENGSKACEEWYKDDEMYRENDEAAGIKYYENGSKALNIIRMGQSIKMVSSIEKILDIMRMRQSNMNILV